jgi:hypothetical protein
MVLSYKRRFWEKVTKKILINDKLIKKTSKTAYYNGTVMFNNKGRELSGKKERVVFLLI